MPKTSSAKRKVSAVDDKVQEAAGSAADADDWMEDVEAPFPRGGGSALSALQYKEVAAEARRDAAKMLLSEGVAPPKKRLRAAASGADEAVNVELHGKDLIRGALLLCAVDAVASNTLLVQLPDGNTGVVDRKEISDELFAATADSDNADNVPDLRKLFQVGEVLAAVVLAAPTPAPSKPAARVHGRPPVPLSLRLSLTQASAIDADGPGLIAGSPIWATTGSVEAHGAIMQTTHCFCAVILLRKTPRSRSTR